MSKQIRHGMNRFPRLQQIARLMSPLQEGELIASLFNAPKGSTLNVVI